MGVLRNVVWGVLAVSAVLVLAPAATSAQPRSVDRGGWTLARTADGQSDLQGVWTNETITPMERPSGVADKAFLTAEEVADAEARSAAGRARREDPNSGFASYNVFWLDAGTEVLSTRQTSLIVDPPDGQAPIQPWAEAARDYHRNHVGDHYQYMRVWDRCVSRGVPGSMLPAGYNNAYRIVQTPDHIVIQYKMIHDVRIIPLDARPFIEDNIRQWMGDSRAHWDGDTLVVETRK